MATLRLNLTTDNSTNANALNWMRGISGAFSTFGWVQSTDTGQIQLNTITCNITNAVASGGFATYTFNSATLPLRNGMSIAVTGCITGAFNITGNIVNLSGTTSGTFQLALVGTLGPEVETATGTVAQYAAVPTLGAVIGYEIWKANDALAGSFPFYIKIEYMDGSSVHFPAIRINIGQGSNGSGTLTTAAGAIGSVQAAGLANGGPFDCVFSGDSGSFRLFFARNLNTNSNNWWINFERSVDSVGNANTDYIYMSLGTRSASSPSAGFGSNWVTQSGSVGTARAAQETDNNNDATTAFQGYVALFPTRPVIGYERNPLLGTMRGGVNDWNDTDIVPISIYTGVPHTYIALKNGGAAGLLLSQAIGAAIGGNNCFLMRYE